MPNFLSPIIANTVATPRVKNPQEYSGGRRRSRIAKLLAQTTAANDFWVLARFNLGDVILKAELSNTAFAAGTLLDLGPYVVQDWTSASTPVLSPVSGGTALFDRFAANIAVDAVHGFAVATPALDIWGTGTFAMASHVPLYEALGYASLALALVDIPAGAVDLAAQLTVGAGTAETAEVVFTYNAGD